MDNQKTGIQRKLTANVIIEKCSHNSKLVFQDSWCTQERVIRFTTPFFRDLFGVTGSNKGSWQSGDYVMYECTNDESGFFVSCVMNLTGASTEEIQTGMKVCKALMIPVSSNDKVTVLSSWKLTPFSVDPNKLFDDFDKLLDTDIPSFEKNLAGKLGRTTLSEEELSEGEKDTYTLNKYERSKKAREACIAAHGTACAVCGIDFAKAYGPEFAGKIEVHHIVPISEIGERYVIDPVRDLVPVCPNCHTALHSKKGGVYTVEELKEMRTKLQ